MSNYYSPYALYPASYTPMPQVNQPGYSYAPAPSYMISVDGEIGARAWQMPANLAPSTVIPLWDMDGKHVYFKSIDAYGRLNPLRKGVVVFEDEAEAPAPQQALPDMSEYVTKEDLATLKQELRSMIFQSRKSTAENRGESK